MSKIPYVKNVNEVNELTDVFINQVKNNDILKYNGDRWANAVSQTGGDLNSLTDTAMTTPYKGQIFSYNNSGKWTNNQIVKSTQQSIGLSVGNITNPSLNSIGIGNQAGLTNQGADSIAIGLRAGTINQGEDSVAIGRDCGSNNQGASSIAIGYVCGFTNHPFGSVGIGLRSQETNPAGNGYSGVGINVRSGYFNQEQTAVAIGFDAGRINQKIFAVAVGNLAGETNQGQFSTALGYSAGQNFQGDYSLAVGNQAGNNLGQQSIAMGTSATTTQTNTIVFNPSSSAYTPANKGFYINPATVRSLPHGIGVNSLHFNSATGEISRSST